MNRLRLLLALCVAAPILLLGNRPTIFTLTSAQGMISDSGIFAIEQDSQGYLWIATHEGVSRFDGFQFRNYGTNEGFDTPPHIHDILIRRSGDLWTGFNLARYNPLSDHLHLFQYPPGPRVIATRLLEDRHRRMWALGLGLYRGRDFSRSTTFERVCLRNEVPCHDEGEFGDAFELASDQSLWIARAKGGLLHRFETGKVELFAAQEGLPFPVLGILCDRQGRIWIGTSNGVFRLLRDASPGRLSVEPMWGTNNGFPGCAVYAFRQTRDGHIWAGGRCGLIELDGTQTKRYSVADGLSQNVIESIFEGNHGELWLGTESAGIMRMERDGISSFGAEAGLDQDVIDGLFATQDGRVAVVSNREGRLVVRVGDEAGFRPALPPLPLQPTDLDVQHWQIVLQDHNGAWWVPGTNQISVFAPASNPIGLPREPKRIYGAASGLPTGRIDCMLEDRKGNIWFGLYRPQRSTLIEWIRSEDRFRSWEGEPGVPRDRVAIALTETRSGSLWIAYRRGELGRFRDGRHLLFPAPKGLGQSIFTLHEDDLGRLWAGRASGELYEIEAPDSDHPRFRQIPDISAPFVRSIVSDHQGRLYLGSESGLIEYDPGTQSVRHFHQRDGLPSDVLQSGMRTRDGTLWFGTGRGLMRFRPRGFNDEHSPQVWIDELDFGGTPAPAISDRGARAITGVRITAPASGLRIAFHSISFRFDVRFQYRLQPGDREWSKPVSERSVTYQRLSGGRYRFAVRALEAGAASGEPATVSFEVLPAFWLRPWFIALALLSATAVLAFLYRSRVMHLLAMERLRMRIASDLHDDLGANLTQIAVVSEQLRSHEHRNGDANQALAQIADSAREMTSSLADAVWSIAPQQDHLTDLLSRMRRLGNDLCEANGVDLVFQSPEDDIGPSVNGHTRRNLFLIFKECLRNAIRHAHCREFRVVYHEHKGFLFFTFADDGSGFDLKKHKPGEGLANMRRRAESINASLSIRSGNGLGTTIEVAVRTGAQSPARRGRGSHDSFGR